MQNEVLRQDEILLKDEKKIRKRWLISLLIIVPLAFVGEFFHYKGGIIFLLRPFLHLIGGWLLYHCAYKKRGTFFLGISTLLMFVLAIITLFGTAAALVAFWRDPFALNGPVGYRACLGIMTYLLVFLVLLEFYFVFISYKLYKVNKAWQKKKLLKNVEHNKDFLNVP